MAEEFGKFEIRIEGVEELIGKLDNNTLIGPVLTRLLGEAAATGANAAKGYAPTGVGGRLKQTIYPKMPRDVIPLWAAVVPQMAYAPYVEYGTSPHWPPLGALADWAKVHDIPEYLIRRKIGLYGTKPHPFMAPAVEDINRALPALVEEAERQMQEIWEEK